MTAKQNKRFRFTNEKLDALPASAKVATYYDADIKTLGVRVQPTGKKSFFMLKQVNGRPQRKTLGTVGELKLDAARMHAQKLSVALAGWKAEGGAGLSPTARPEKGLAFAEAFEQYLRGVRLRSKNPDKAERGLHWLLTTYLGSLKTAPIESITGQRLSSLHTSIAEKNRPYAANRAIEVVRGVFRFLVKKGLAERDPSQAVTMCPEKKRERFLQPDELIRLHAALQSEPNGDLRDFVTLLLATGVRKSSLYAARFAEISEALETWTIPETKNGSPLTVQLTPTALRILQTRRKRVGDSSPWVFPSKTSESGHVEDFKNQWNRLRKAAAVADVTFHDLRRTAASYMAISGASLPTIGGALGHKSASSTEVYARLHGDAVRRSLLAGEAMQTEMMAAARKQIKAAARKQRRLPAATTAGLANQT